MESYGWRTAYLLTGLVVGALCIPAAQLMRRPAAGSSPAATRPGPAEQGVRLSRSPRFWVLALVWCIHGAVGAGLIVHYFAHILSFGHRAAVASAVVATLGAVGVIGGLLGGAVGDWLGSTRALVAGYLLTAVALLLLTVSETTAAFITVSVLFGLAWFGVGVLVPLVAASLFGTRQLGSVLGLLELTWALGGAAGPALLGWMYDLHGTYMHAWGWLLGLAVVATSLATLLRPDRPTPP